MNHNKCPANYCMSYSRSSTWLVYFCRVLALRVRFIYVTFFIYSVFTASASATISGSFFTFDLAGNIFQISTSNTVPSSTIWGVQSHVGASGQGTGLSVLPSGSPPFLFQWLVNGNAIPGATSDSIYLANVSTAMLGNYSVIVSNVTGVVTSTPAFLSYDSDSDGLPDSWEYYYFGNLAQSGTNDSDGDGVSNYQEMLDGTDPTDPTSVFPRLTLRASGGTVTSNPNLSKYNYQQAVILTATPSPGQFFLGWSGDASGTTNPLTIFMNRSKSVSAVFGLDLGTVLETTNLTWNVGGNAGWFGQTNTTHDGVDAAQSGPINNGEQSWLETTKAFNDFGTVTFWWKLAGTSNTLAFLVNVVQQPGALIGDTNWQQATYFLSGQTNVLRWVFSKTAPNSPYFQNAGGAGWIDQVSFQDVQTVPLGVALNATNLNWNSSSTARWFGQTNASYDGVASAQSSPLGANSQSWLQTTNIMSTDGALRFWWNVSCDPTLSSLSLAINGQLQASIAGQTGWQNQSYFLGAGTNVLRWTFTQGAIISTNTSNAAWVDLVNITPYPDVNTDSNAVAALIYRGGVGDGFSDATYYDAPVNGASLASGVFAGGIGDGYADSTYFNFQPNGQLLAASIYRGNYGDGYYDNTYYDFPVKGFYLAQDAFFGGSGDGYYDLAGTNFGVAQLPHWIMPPPMQFIQRNGSNVLVTLNTIPGYPYQVQYATNLQPTGWSNLTSFVATNTLASFVDITRTNKQRFYRILVVP